ncbi:hypothetical protein C8R47DRAFT_1289983 [Mycena vitilis]|nr:hypothetical protein C8R47DRAFT_1289983 [Mycena vitilis]
MFFSPLTALFLATAALAAPSSHEVALAEHVLPSRSTKMECADPVKRTAINSGINQAWVLSLAAKRYINEQGSTDPLYIAYFGANDPARILSVFNIVANAVDSPTLLNLQCVCEGYTGAGYSFPANSYYNETATARFCDKFFTQLRTTRAICNSPPPFADNGYTTGGVSLHLLAHALITDVYEYNVYSHSEPYGCSEVRNLPDADKRNNAENYNCYAAEVYKKTQC